MYTTIITSLFLIVVCAESYLYFAVDNSLKKARLKYLVTFRRIVRSLILIEFTVFNFLFSFARPEYVFQLILQILGNVVALIYFFLDLFYFSQRNRGYLLWMQDIVFSKTPLEEAFEVIDANEVEFKERKKDPQQFFGLVQAGKDKGLCIHVPSKDGDFLLKPKKLLDEETLMFYARKLEMDIEKEEINMFAGGNLPPEVFQEYDFGKQSRIYLWLRDKLFSEKGKMIMVFVIVGLFVALALAVIIAQEAFHYDLLNDWFMGKL